MDMVNAKQYYKIILCKAAFSVVHAKYNNFMLIAAQSKEEGTKYLNMPNNDEGNTENCV